MAFIKEAIKQLFRKPATIEYPIEKSPVPLNFRGRPVWEIDKCIGCGLCVFVCPSGAVQMNNKGLEAEIQHYLDRCMFCAQCVETCPKIAIFMSKEFELAGSSRQDMSFKYQRNKLDEKKSEDLNMEQ